MATKKTETPKTVEEMVAQREKEKVAKDTKKFAVIQEGTRITVSKAAEGTE